MSNAERDGIVGAYRAGRILVLTSVAILGEGFDVGETAGVILLRPTASLTLCLQQIGRALRPKQDMGEKAIILDAVGNLLEHGLPCAERRWSLDGRAKDDKKSSSGEVAKVCRRCEALNHPAARHCVACGHPFPVQKREIKQVNGELRELDPKTAHLVTRPLRFAVRGATSLAELEQIATARVGAGVMKLNYPPITWARRVWRKKLAARERNPHRRQILEAGSQSETEALLRDVDEALWIKEVCGYSDRWFDMLAERKGWSSTFRL